MLFSDSCRIRMLSWVVTPRTFETGCDLTLCRARVFKIFKRKAPQRHKLELKYTQTQNKLWKPAFPMVIKQHHHHLPTWGPTPRLTTGLVLTMISELATSRRKVSEGCALFLSWVYTARSSAGVIAWPDAERNRGESIVRNWQWLKQIFRRQIFFV